METKEIIENNILIAWFLKLKEFSGLFGISVDHPQESIFRDYSTGTFTDEDYNIYYSYNPTDMAFNYSFDWLFLAVDKISDIKGGYNTLYTLNEICSLQGFNNIQDLYISVVQFIKTYNTTNK